MERQELIERILSNPDNSHFVFGCFGSQGGHYIQESKGMRRFNRFDEIHIEKEFEEVFKGRRYYAEFVGRVHGKKMSNKDFYKVTLCFDDFRGDSRPESHTDYALLLFRRDNILEVVPEIKKDPSIMIDLFRRLFPTYDRSQGKLVIDSEVPERMEEP